MRAHTTAEELLADRPLIAAIGTWASSAKVDNMCIERALALIRLSVPTKNPFGEGLIAAGFLAQWKSVHTTHGGQDPRGISRQSLRELAVPTSTNAKQKGTTETPTRSRAGVFYMLDQVRKRKRESGPLSRAEHYRERASLLREFGDLSEEIQRPFVHQAEAVRSPKPLKRTDTSEPTQCSQSSRCPKFT